MVCIRYKILFLILFFGGIFFIIKIIIFKYMDFIMLICIKGVYMLIIGVLFFFYYFLLYVDFIIFFFF